MSVVKLHSAGELLASIPALLGFVPHDSLVVVGLVRGRKLGLVVRLDRADCEVPDVAVELGAAIVSHLIRDGAREALVVSYVNSLTPAPDAPLDFLVSSLKRLIPVRDAWVVAPDRYRSQWCEDQTCCPTGGLRLPLPSPSVQQTSLARTGPGARLRDDRTSNESADARRRVARARARAVAAHGRGESLWRHKRWGEWQEAVSQALDGRMPPDALAGRLLAGFEDTRVRDAIVVSLHGGALDVAQAVIDEGDAYGVREVLSHLIRGGASADPARVEAAIDVAMYVSRAACGPRVTRGCAGPLTVAAIGEWWLGDTRTASYLLDAAVAMEPEYRLARLAAATIAAGLSSGPAVRGEDGLGHLRP